MPAKQAVAKSSAHEIWLKGKCAGVYLQEKELENLATPGPCVVVCNRFSSKYEDALLSAIIKNTIKNYRLITTYRKAAGYLNDSKIICVKKSSLDTWGQLKEGILKVLHEGIANGETVVLFPSRRIRRYSLDKIAWDKEIVAAIQKSNVPVIPVFIKPNKEDVTIYLQQLAANPYQILSDDGDMQFDLRIGKPIKPADIEKFTSPKQFRRFLFAKTHALGSSLEVDKFYHFAPAPDKQKNIDKNIEPGLLQKEIEQLAAYKMAAKGDLEAYICPTLVIPNIMKEIGVQREITYREAGEGTGKSTDIDEYDLYYRQLFIWDKAENKVIGGYRLGCGDEIMKTYGRTGFYVHSLFWFDRRFDDYWGKTLEMGRSFIIKEYQKDPFPLFLLWKAIYAFLKNSPQYKYLLGPVSISADYSPFSRQLIVAFLKEHFSDKELAEYIEARNPLVEKISSREKKALLSRFDGILNNLDKFIEEIEPRHFKVPVLIKQYLKQNAKFIGFNVDPAFANSIDCLMILDTKNLPSSTTENM
ncbi:MAG TPA: GNAT family N-acyltransferase, partial [Chitinophagales bacterium]|nr:GNAT family N-acyltransferase [Chitinophagales bacterium]